MDKSCHGRSGKSHAAPAVRYSQVFYIHSLPHSGSRPSEVQSARLLARSYTIARILDRLESEKFIDDERFCRAFVNDKFRFAKWGKMKIAQGLYMKKIPSDVAWRYLNEIDEEEYLSILRDLLASKRKSIHAADDYELNGKLMRFAMSRGFELKDIKRCIDIPDEEEQID